MSDNKTTIGDIARICGVSIKSVSRAINNEPGVSDRTQARILSVIKEWDYRPDRRKRSKTRQSTRLIALVYHYTHSLFINDIAHGALHAADKAGYELILLPISRTGADGLRQLQTMLDRSGVDGMILAPPFGEANIVISYMNDIAIPIIRISGDDLETPITKVHFDDRVAAYDATSHLIELGHRDIAMVAGHEMLMPTARRVSGFKAALEAHNIEVNPNWIIHGMYTFLSGVEAGTRLLMDEHRPGAIVCSNDDMAAGVIHAASRLNLKIAEDCSIIGFDDSPLASKVWPPLTTIRQPLFEIGEESARLLVKLIDKPDLRLPSCTFRHQLVVRKSTGHASPQNKQSHVVIGS